MTIITTEHGHKIEFNQEKHVYIRNNEYVVGMSTILGKLASPMLENWKIANQVNAIKKEMEKQGISIDKIETIILNAKTNAKKHEIFRSRVRARRDEMRRIKRSVHDSLSGAQSLADEISSRATFEMSRRSMNRVTFTTSLS